MKSNSYFPEFKGNFGFGCMRFPTVNGEIDIQQVKLMFDKFLEAGFNYFDTAHGYHGGKSETTIKECLTSRYPRDKYLITDKLSDNFFESEADIRPFFESQLEAVGVDYFDFYLMHAQNAKNFKKYKAARAYETALELKREGKIRHLGISFHDKHEVLDQILTEYPEIEIVQIQYNYFDLEHPFVQSRECRNVCEKHGKPMLVMEPVKGGSLVNLPDRADAVLRSLGEYSNAGYAIRFAASAPGVVMVLSGMSSVAMVEDNIKTMQNFVPLTDAEREAIMSLPEILHSEEKIGCTDCKYCMERCPMNIPIPEYFAIANDRWAFDARYKYSKLAKDTERGNIDSCIGCEACSHSCPQHLAIPELLKKVKKTFS